MLFFVPTIATIEKERNDSVVVVAIALLYFCKAFYRDRNLHKFGFYKRELE